MRPVNSLNHTRWECKYHIQVAQVLHSNLKWRFHQLFYTGRAQHLSSHLNH